MMPDPLSNAAAAFDNAAAARPKLSPELQRALMQAVFRAKPDCCETCTKLLPLQESMFQALEQSEPPAPPAPTAAEPPPPPPLAWERDGFRPEDSPPARMAAPRASPGY